MITRKDGVILKKYDLEKDLYKFYNDSRFSFLFEDVCKRESIDNNYVDLSNAFEMAYALGLLIFIHDTGDVKSIINLSEEDAIQIQSEFKSNEVDAMSGLCNEIKVTNKQLVLKKFKILSLTEKVCIYHKNVLLCICQGKLE